LLGEVDWLISWCVGLLIASRRRATGYSWFKLPWSMRGFPLTDAANPDMLGGERNDWDEKKFEPGGALGDDDGCIVASRT